MTIGIGIIGARFAADLHAQALAKLAPFGRRAAVRRHGLTSRSGHTVDAHRQQHRGRRAHDAVDLADLVEQRVQALRARGAQHGEVVELAAHRGELAIDPGRMHGAAGELHAVIKGLLLAVRAGKGGQKGRVNVHDAHGEGTKKKRRENPHETGKHDDLHLMGLQSIHEFPVVFLPVLALGIWDADFFNFVAFGALQNERVGLVGDDY